MTVVARGGLETKPTLSFSDFMQTAKSELQVLGHDYLQLAGLKMHLAADHAKKAVMCLALTVLFGVIAIGETVFATMGLCFAKDPGVREYSTIVGYSAGACILLAVLCGLGAKHFFTQLSLQKMVGGSRT